MAQTNCTAQIDTSLYIMFFHETRQGCKLPRHSILRFNPAARTKERIFGAKLPLGQSTCDKTSTKQQDAQRSCDIPGISWFYQGDFSA